MPIAARLDMVGIVVSDMARSLAFYRLLGLDIPVEADTEAHVEVTLTGGLRLGFDTEAVVLSFHASWTPPTGGGRVSLSFEVSTPGEVDALHAAVVGAGYRGEVAPFDAPWGQRYCSVYDAEGTWIDLFARLAS